jgi:hypothetical protein
MGDLAKDLLNILGVAAQQVDAHLHPQKKKNKKFS